MTRAGIVTGKPGLRDRRDGHARHALIRRLVPLLTVFLLSGSSGLLATAQAAEWRSDYALRPRPDGPGLSSLAPPVGPETYLADGPDSPEARNGWLDAMRAWRAARLKEIGYHDELYRRVDLSWTRHVFTQDQLLAQDRSLYDPDSGRYTVDRALAGIESRFGPLDSVLIWPAYPNIGLDARNQLDLLRDMPGGIPGLRSMVADFHRRGVRVFFPVVIWDRGTRDEGGSFSDASMTLLHEIGADGINFDTLDTVPDANRKAGERLSPPIAFEPQFDPQNASLADSAISWSDWVLWDDLKWPFVPRVSRVKWLEPRHATLITDRYARFKINSLQTAFLNGAGYVLIENIWGFWNGFSERDAEAVRRFTRIERAFSGLMVSRDWEPLVPVLQSGVYASRFPGKDRVIWTLANRNDYAVDGEQIALPVRPGARYYDLWRGRALHPEMRDGRVVLRFSMEALGFGAILEDRSGAPGPDLVSFLSTTAKDANRPLDSLSRATPFARQSMVPVVATPVWRGTVPDGMVRIPAADYDFRVNGIEIENGDDPGTDVQFDWETSPRRSHRHRMHIASFLIDRTPVTNDAFRQFLQATGYHPKDDHNFLRGWRGGTYPAGWANRPVTWVSIEDARAYAHWAGKRLPHVWEWQYAAQGMDGRLYPWGNTWDASAVPPKDTSRTPRPPSEVSAYPAGASPFGVLDMEGNVAQWTDEFRDEHTRAAILRGGDYYRPAGSMWYFPKSDRLDEQEKYLLLSPGRDRSGTVGFRCVRDLPGAP